MADSEGKNYYWESLDQNTTGENVGVVLDSLCDIVAENEAEEDQNVVKWIPGEEGQKGHFELGEGGEKVPPISSNLNEIIIGDGNNWAKRNNNEYYITFSNNNENIIGSFISTPIAFGTLTAPISGQTLPTLKNGYKAQNNAIADISGNAQLYMRENSYIKIEDNSKLCLQNGICIYARYNPDTNEPGIEIVNCHNSEINNNVEEIDRVEFTFDELKYLKRFIGTLPSKIANDDSEATEPNTLYFIPEE